MRMALYIDNKADLNMYDIGIHIRNIMWGLFGIMK